jgi:hypothetical protein
MGEIKGMKCLKCGIENMDKLYATAYDWYFSKDEYVGWYCSTCNYFWNRNEIELKGGD